MNTFLEDKSVVIAAFVVALILLFFIRAVLRKNKEERLLNEKLEQEDLLDDFPGSGDEDLFEEPGEQKLIPRDDIETKTDEQQKELDRIGNFLIENETRNIDKAEFFDLQERVYIYDPGNVFFSFELEHIYRISENRFVSLIDFERKSEQDPNQGETIEKRLFGIISCSQEIGKGYLVSDDTGESLNENQDGTDTKQRIRIGQRVLIPRDYVDVTVAEELCRELEDLPSECTVWFDGDRIYIMTESRATLNDLQYLVELLKKFPY